MNLAIADHAALAIVIITLDQLAHCDFLELDFHGIRPLTRAINPRLRAISRTCRTVSITTVIGMALETKSEMNCIESFGGNEYAF